ncbi:MAG: TrkA C-terminal domain-containing protein [Candidatus Diapherotrites archaeon]
MNSKMEIRIWEGSPLVGMSVEKLDKKFGVNVLKVARGVEAANPKGNLKIEAADYITYVGDPANCLKVLEKSVK